MKSAVWYLPIFLWMLCSVSDSAFGQSCGFSSGKSLHELQLATTNTGRTFPFIISAIAKPAPVQPENRIFLPQWTAADLPFFCKMEYSWSKVHGRTPVKFRLGSVDYVDWLEGKSFDKTRF